MNFPNYNDLITLVYDFLTASLDALTAVRKSRRSLLPHSCGSKSFNLTLARIAALGACP